MKLIKQTLVLALTAIFAPLSQATLVNFHFGPVTQTGPGVVGSAGDLWNATNISRGGPLPLLDSTGVATTIALTWNSGDAWGKTGTVCNNATSTSMDPATIWLMRSFALSYQYSNSATTNLKLDFSGLTPSQGYTMTLLAAGDQINEGTKFTIVGTGTFTAATTAPNRRLSKGEGYAYTTVHVISSSTGTLKITTTKNNYGWAIVNGFQLVEDEGLKTSLVKPAVTTTPAPPQTPTQTPSHTATPVTSQSSSDIVWGVCGHPTWTDYSNYIPANNTAQINYLKELGATAYRCSFEGAEYPAILKMIVPAAKTAGITVLPILPVSLKPTSNAQDNYSANYQIGYTWATYAISQNYNLPYWELGNEVENWNLVKVVYDGASADDFPDAQAGGFVAIASGLTGAYQGIKDAYTAGRSSGLTTLTPQILIGATYRHWGLLKKIQNYNNGFLPCDIISWHWYGPNYGAFNAAISDANSVANGRTPAQCLGDFKSHSDPTQPMDIWITETDRSARSGTSLFNGSVTNNSTPAANQDWAAQAAAIKANIDSFKTISSVKAIFVYELFDEPKADGGSTTLLASEGYMGLITGLNGTRKDAFYTFQAEIQSSN